MSSQQLPDLRELYSHRPESRYLDLWELQTLLWSLRYTDDLIEEAEIAAAVEVAREDLPDLRAI